MKRLKSRLTVLALTAMLSLFAVILAQRAVAPAFAAEHLEVPDDFLLAAGRVGFIRINSSVDDLYRKVPRERLKLVDLQREGHFTPAFEIYLEASQQSPSMVAVIESDRCVGFAIWGVSVCDSRFRTREGLGVGSTLSELQRHFTVTLERGEGSGEFAVIKELQLSFILAKVAPTAADRRVTEVWVIPQLPEAHCR